MKKYLLLVVVAVIMLNACDNAEKNVTGKPTDISVIRQKAGQLSLEHDSLVKRMLQVEQERILQKAKTTGVSTAGLNRDEMLDVIYEVTGIRPVIMNEGDKPFKVSQSGSDAEDYPVINFDAEQLSLATFAPTELSQTYLNKVDDIIAGEELNIAEKLYEISVVQDAVCQDVTAGVQDVESVLYGTEILKGSLVLWNNEPEFKVSPAFKNGMQRAVPLTSWKFWQKLGFVAAADAIGGVLGFWVGGYITVGGVTMWMPPGPGGAAMSAAGLSYIAAKMVGW